MVSTVHNSVIGRQIQQPQRSIKSSNRKGVSNPATARCIKSDKSGKINPTNLATHKTITHPGIRAHSKQSRISVHSNQHLRIIAPGRQKVVDIRLACVTPQLHRLLAFTRRIFHFQRCSEHFERRAQPQPARTLPAPHSRDADAWAPLRREVKMTQDFFLECQRSLVD